MRFVVSCLVKLQSGSISWIVELGKDNIRRPKIRCEGVRGSSNFSVETYVKGLEFMMASTSVTDV